MNAVHLNGVSLLEGIDYFMGDATISFATPPVSKSEILVTEVVGSKGATHVTRLIGNGNKFVFTLDRSFEQNLLVQEMLDQAYKYRHVPAVEDILEKLKVVIELVKQHDTVSKR